MDYKPDIGEHVFVLGTSGIHYGVVVERREVEKADGITEGFLVEYYDSLTGCGYCAEVFCRAQLEAARYAYGLGKTWIEGNGSEAKAFAERRSAELLVQRAA